MPGVSFNPTTVMRTIFPATRSGSVREAEDDEEQDYMDRTRYSQLGEPRLNREDVLGWFLSCNEQDALWVLDHLGGVTPHVLHKAVARHPVRLSFNSLAKFSKLPRSLSLKIGDGDVELSPREGRENTDSDAVLQFSAPIYFVTEEDTQAQLEVIRIGNSDQKVHVRWATQDASGKAGVRYEATSGVLDFEPGERIKPVQVPLIGSDAWESVTEFHVALDSEGLRGASLGPYLSQARVKVIDNDMFPTNLYAREIKMGEVEEVPALGLLWEYFKMNLMNRTVRRGTIKRMAGDVMHSLYFLMNLMINVYLVDHILRSDANLFFFQQREQELLLVLVAEMVPLAALHYFDYSKRAFGVSGTSRNTVQAALLAKFLNYDESTRGSMRPSDLIMGMARDSAILVQDGYMRLFELAIALGHILMILVFQLISPVVFGKKYAWAALALSGLFPVVMLLTLVCRVRTTVGFLDDRNHQQGLLIDHVVFSILNYGLIADYHHRPYFTSKQEDYIHSYNKTYREANQVLQNNKYIVKYLTTLIVCAYTFVGGCAMLHGSQSLGMVLVSIRTLNECGKAWNEIYDIGLHMYAVLPSLQRLVVLMNQPTDLERRRAVHDAMRCETNVLMHQVAVDDMPIKVGMLSIPQGNLVCFVGPHGHGKSRLLSLIGQHTIAEPQQGDPHVFVPSHLRVLHISREAMFFHGTLYDNLTFGVKPGHHGDADHERVIHICRQLNLSERVIEFIRMSESTNYTTACSWSRVMSHSNASLLNLARALTANPDVLILHQPMAGYDDETKKVVVRVLRDFVTKRGVGKPEAERHLRRPTTCILTTYEVVGISSADMVVHVTDGIGRATTP